MTVELVDRNVISRSADFQPPPEPHSDSGPVRAVVNVVEKSGACEHFFAAGIIADLQIDPGFGVALAQPLERGRVHYEVTKPVIREHKDALDSRRVEPSLGSHPQAQLQPALDGYSYRRFQYLLYRLHSRFRLRILSRPVRRAKAIIRPCVPILLRLQPERSP